MLVGNGYKGRVTGLGPKSWRDTEKTIDLDECVSFITDQTQCALMMLRWGVILL